MWLVLGMILALHVSCYAKREACINGRGCVFTFLNICKKNLSVLTKLIQHTTQFIKPLLTLPYEILKPYIISEYCDAVTKCNIQRCATALSRFTGHGLERLFWDVYLSK